MTTDSRLNAEMQDPRRSPPHGRGGEAPTMGGGGYSAGPWGNGHERDITPGVGDPHGSDWARRRVDGEAGG